MCQPAGEVLLKEVLMDRNQRRIGIILAVLLVVFAFGCERNITTIEEVKQTSVLPAQNCLVCHSDDDTGIIAAAGQWANSKHASGENINRNEEPCAKCHTSEGFVHFADTGEVLDLVENPTAIHCFTCHAPHSNGNFSLRITAVQPLQDGASMNLGASNICITCHQSRRDVNTYISASESITSIHWGPHHSVQGDMLIGSNGYEYSGYDYDIQTNHKGTGGGCLDCHFETSNSYYLGGHSFNMAYEIGHDEVYNTLACARCHSDMEEADDFNRAFAGGAGIQDSVQTLIATLQGMLETAGLIAFDPEEGHVLPLPGIKTSADSAGAIWNWLMAEEDRSHGVHNPRYIVNLLYSSILFLQGPAGTSAETASLNAEQEKIVKID